MSKFKNGEDYYNHIYLVFNALIAVSLLPFSFILLEMQGATIYDKMLGDTLSYLLMALTISITAYFTYQSFKQIKSFRAKPIEHLTLRVKLESYRSIIVQHYIYLSLFCLLVTVVLYMTRSNLMVVYYVFLLVLLSINRPTLKRIVEQLKLSKQEQEILYEKSEIAQ